MMKVKMLIALAVTSLVVGTLTYAAPSDDPDAAAPMQAPATGGMGMTGEDNSTPANGVTGGMGGALEGATTPGADIPSTTTEPGNNQSSEVSNSNDDMSVDTATGDDDY